MALTFFAVYN